MKTKLLLLTLIASVFVSHVQAQNRTIINAQNSEISDNLDLRAVASIFGDCRNLQDFERRLNDPKLRISNLDLNNDNEVDYLRVIESVKKQTHVIIIQSVLDRDFYQDIATIEVEKDWDNDIHIQVVGNAYLYGNNYIYEPVYYSTPFIYTAFWSWNYRPYYSSWAWNYYPSYYYAWNPFPVYRYQYNVHNCLNINNEYNYVNYRRSYTAERMYDSRRSNSYERQHPEYSFSRRNSNVSNRFELEQNRNSRNGVGYSQNGNNQQRSESQRGYSQRESAPQRTDSQRGYSQNRNEAQRESVPQRTESQRGYSQSRTEVQRESAPQRTENQREYSQNRTEVQRESTPQRTEPQRGYSQSRTEVQRESAPQRTESQRGYSQNRNEAQRESAPQRTESPGAYAQNRGNTSSENTQQRSQSNRDNSSSSRNNERRQ